MARMKTIQSLRLDSFLSFPPDSDALDLQPLNVLIGPNGAGKSNVIEAVELLRATPQDFANAIRDGGGAAEWIWKGNMSTTPATLEVVLEAGTPTYRPLRYRLEFANVQGRVEVLDEAIEEVEPRPGHDDVFFYYRFQRGNPAISVKNGDAFGTRHLERDALLPDQSVLAQRKDPEQYPEVTWLGRRFAAIRTFREWSFGRYGALRRPQPADLPEDGLLPDSSNLALLLNQIEHHDVETFNSLLRRFLPRFERMSTRVSGGNVQFYLHQPGLSTAIPATRLSDGTIRFIAILAILLSPAPPPLVAMEEPELGLHPDALAIIAELLVEASSRMQLVVTTHSDALVSALSTHVEAVVACEQLGVGTTLRRLDPEGLAQWLKEYQLGDLWRMGELGANP